MAGVDDIIQKIKPDLAVVHGDTTTCFAAALVAFTTKLKLPTSRLGCERGTYFPPEEANRQLVVF